MLRFRLQLGDFEKIPRALEDFHSDLEDFSPFLKKRFVPAYLEDVNTNFDTEGGLVGGWDELSSDYERWKRKHHGDKLINVLSRKIRLSMSPKGRSQNIVLEYHKKSVVIGSKVPYAKHVDDRRRFILRAGDLDRGKYNKLLVDWMIELLKKRKLRGGRS